MQRGAIQLVPRPVAVFHLKEGLSVCYAELGDHCTCSEYHTVHLDIVAVGPLEDAPLSSRLKRTHTLTSFSSARVYRRDPHSSGMPSASSVRRMVRMRWDPHVLDIRAYPLRKNSPAENFAKGSKASRVRYNTTRCHCIFSIKQSSYRGLWVCATHLPVPLPRAAPLIVATRAHALHGASPPPLLHVAQSETLSDLLGRIPRRLVAGPLPSIAAPIAAVPRHEALAVPHAGRVVRAPGRHSVLLHPESHVLPVKAADVATVLPRDALRVPTARCCAVGRRRYVRYRSERFRTLPPQVLVSLPGRGGAGWDLLDRRRHPGGNDEGVNRRPRAQGADVGR